MSTNNPEVKKRNIAAILEEYGFTEDIDQLKAIQNQYLEYSAIFEKILSPYKNLPEGQQLVKGLGGIAQVLEQAIALGSKRADLVKDINSLKVKAITMKIKDENGEDGNNLDFATALLTLAEAAVSQKNSIKDKDGSKEETYKQAKNYSELEEHFKNVPVIGEENIDVPSLMKKINITKE